MFHFLLEILTPFLEGDYRILSLLEHLKTRRA